MTPEDEQDVVKAVQFAADHGLKVSARGTGHQISGIAVPSCGIVIDMSNLNKISLAPDQQTATVQASIYTSFHSFLNIPSDAVLMLFMKIRSS